jgi:thiol-disulfide isomerase/thioredoxin
MRKAVLAVIVCAVIIACASCASGEPKLEMPVTDAARFAAEYMELNGQLRGNGEPHFILDISEDNPVIYLEADEVISKLESGTGIINLGFPSCPWCREIVPHLIELTERESVPLYYMNIQPIRDVMELNESGEIITATEGTPEYHRMVEILHDWLWEYAGLDDPEIKRIYVPTTIFVRDGEILYVHIATLRENYIDGYKPLSDEQAERVTGYLNDAMTQIFKGADNGADGGCDECP